jgi:proline dehydrogenase
LSIKLPSLRFSAELLGEVVQRAQSVKRRLHFDAMAPETADRTRAMIDEALAATPDVEIGITLPGRWQRSLDDARWACQRGLFVRVVKGEWADPLDLQRDPRGGYLEIIDQLAGKARWVGVATHDPKLAAEAIGRLQAAGTPCGLELLYGLPMRKQIEQARKLGVGVRVYVPYGEAYMPYALSQVRRKPRILWWLLRDLVASKLV